MYCGSPDEPYAGYVALPSTVTPGLTDTGLPHWGTQYPNVLEPTWSSH